MRTRALCLLISLCLLAAAGGSASAAGSEVSITIDGAALEQYEAIQVRRQTTYVSYWPIVKALCPDATAVWDGKQAVVRASGLEMKIRPGSSYLEANGRYLWVPEGFMTENNLILVPVRVLGQVLGASVTWDGAAGAVRIRSGSGPIRSGANYYDAGQVYWLSHIINAESGNQPLAGKIAVGNVVLNRAASPRFPNSVRGVIFQQGQFTPAQTGSIYLTPNEESVIAAKLCLEGANTAGNSLYFVNPRTCPNSWAARSRPYVATIGAHAFFA